MTQSHHLPPASAAPFEGVSPGSILNPSLWEFTSSRQLWRSMLEAAIWGALTGPFVAALMSGALVDPKKLWADWSPHPQLLWILPMVGVFWATSITFFGALDRYYLMPKIRPNWGPIRQFTLISLAGFACGAIAMVCIHLLCFHVLGVQTFPKGHLASRASIAGVLGIFIGNMMYLFYLNQVELTAAAEREQKLERYRMEAQLMNLNLRMRPHFFFNAINTLSGLMDRNTEQAQEFLADLSDLFRQSFAMGQSGHSCSWSEERSLVEHYLRVEQRRFGPKLNWTLEVDAPDDAPFPAFLLQPILENAVYHGISACTDQGEIRLRGCYRNGTWQLEVVNTTAEKANAKIRPGHALAVLDKRLTLMDGTLEVCSEERRFIVRMEWKDGGSQDPPPQ